MAVDIHKRNSILEYTMRIGKSVAFGAFDAFKEQMPFTTQLVENNKESAKQIFQDVFVSKTQLRKLQYLEDTYLFKPTAEIMKNIKEDIRTGKFYDQARADAVREYGESKLMESLLDDEGFGDLSDILSGEEEFTEEDAEEMPITPVTQITTGDTFVASIISKESRASTNSLLKAHSSLADAQLKTMRTIGDMQIKQIQRTTNIMTQGFGQMTSGFNMINEFNTKVMLQHVKNAKQYFETMVNLTQENNAILKELIEMKRELFKAYRNNDEASKSDDDTSVFNGAGVLNLKNYWQTVQRQFKESELGAVMQMVPMVFMGLSDIIANPMHFVSKTLTSGFIGRSLRKTLQNFDKTLNGFIQNGLIKLGKLGKKQGASWIEQLLGSVFGIDASKVSLGQVDLTKQLKGPRQWDAEDHYYLTKVIPSYMARMEAALTGNPERIFNPNTGKFQTLKSVAKMREKADRDMAKDEMAEVLAQLRAGLFRTMKLDPKNKNHTKDINDLNKALTDFAEGVHKAGGFGDKDFVELLDNLNNQYGELSDVIYTMIKNGYVSKNAIMTAQQNINSNALAERKNRLNGNIRFDELIKASNADRTFNESSRSRISGNVKTVSALEKAANYNLLEWQAKIHGTLIEIRDRIGNIGMPGPGGNNNGPSQPNGPKGSPQNAKINRMIILDEDEEGYPIIKKITRAQDRKGPHIYEKNGIIYWPRGEILKKNGVYYHKNGHVWWTPSSDVMDEQDTGKLLDIQSRYSPDKIKDPAFREGYKQALRNAARRNAEYNMSQEMDIEGSIFDFGDDDGTAYINARLQNEFHVNPKDPFLKQLAKAATLGDKIGVISANIDKIIASPRTMLTSVLTQADKLMYEVIFGKDEGEKDREGNPIKGLFGKLKNELEEMSIKMNEKISSWADTLYNKYFNKDNVLDKVDKAKYWIKQNLGIDINATMDSAKGIASNFFSSGKDAGSNIFNSIKNAVSDTMADIGITNRAYGSGRNSELNSVLSFISKDEAILHGRGRGGITPRVKKGGLYALGKGDYVIPSTMNPWNPNRKSASIAKDAAGEERMRQELKNKISNIPGYAQGGILDSLNQDDFLQLAAGLAGEFGIDPALIPIYIAQLAGGELGDKFRNLNLNKETKQGLDIILQKLWRNKALRKSPQTSNILRAALESAGYKNLPDERQMRYEEYNRQSSPINGMKMFFSQAFGKDPEQAAEETKKLIIHNTPELMTGGMKGALVGTIFPLGGPLMGAIAGSALEVLRNNESFMSFMFGDKIVGKDGEVTRNDKGIISTKFMKDLEKYIPDMKKYGITGSLIGLVTPFGPLGGLMAGIAASYVKNNDQMNRFLFGSEGDNKSGIFNKDRREAIKKALPNVGIGMLSTFFLGPFGLLGNAALGAGLGLLSTTEKFKKVMLGAKDKNGVRHGGLAGAIVRHITNPLKASMDSMKKDIKEWLRDDIVRPIGRGLAPIGKEVRDQLRDGVKWAVNLIERNLVGSSGFFEKLWDRTFGTVRRAGGIGKWLVKNTVGRLGRGIAGGVQLLGDLVQKRRLNRGKETGMSARERIRLANDLENRHGILSKFMNFKDHDLSTFDTNIANMDIDLVNQYAKIMRNNAHLYSPEMANLITKDESTAFDQLTSGIAEITQSGDDNASWIHDDLINFAERIKNSDNKSDYDEAMSDLNEFLKKKNIKQEDREKLFALFNDANIKFAEVKERRKMASSPKASYYGRQQVEKIRKELLGGKISEKDFVKLMPRLLESLESEAKSRHNLRMKRIEEAKSNGNYSDGSEVDPTADAEVKTTMAFALNDIDKQGEQLLDILRGKTPSILEGIHAALTDNMDVISYNNALSRSKLWMDKANKDFEIENVHNAKTIQDKTSALGLKDLIFENKYITENLQNIFDKKEYRGVTEDLLALKEAHNQGNTARISIDYAIEVDPGNKNKLLNKITTLAIAGYEADPSEYEIIATIPKEGIDCAAKLLMMGSRIQDISKLKDCLSNKESRNDLMAFAEAQYMNEQGEIKNLAQTNTIDRLVANSAESVIQDHIRKGDINLHVQELFNAGDKTSYIKDYNFDNGQKSKAGYDYDQFLKISDRSQYSKKAKADFNKQTGIRHKLSNMYDAFKGMQLGEIDLKDLGAASLGFFSGRDSLGQKLKTGFRVMTTNDEFRSAYMGEIGRINAEEFLSNVLLPMVKENAEEYSAEVVRDCMNNPSHISLYKDAIQNAIATRNPMRFVADIKSIINNGTLANEGINLADQIESHAAGGAVGAAAAAGASKGGGFLSGLAKFAGGFLGEGNDSEDTNEQSSKPATSTSFAERLSQGLGYHYAGLGTAAASMAGSAGTVNMGNGSFIFMTQYGPKRYTMSSTDGQLMEAQDKMNEETEARQKYDMELRERDIAAHEKTAEAFTGINKENGPKEKKKKGGLLDSLIGLATTALGPAIASIGAGLGPILSTIGAGIAEFAANVPSLVFLANAIRNIATGKTEERKYEKEESTIFGKDVKVEIERGPLNKFWNWATGKGNKFDGSKYGLNDLTNYEQRNAESAINQGKTKAEIVDRIKKAREANGGKPVKDPRDQMSWSDKIGEFYSHPFDEASRAVNFSDWGTVASLGLPRALSFLGAGKLGRALRSHSAQIGLYTAGATMSGDQDPLTAAVQGTAAEVGMDLAARGVASAKDKVIARATEWAATHEGTLSDIIKNVVAKGDPKELDTLGKILKGEEDLFRAGYEGIGGKFRGAASWVGEHAKGFKDMLKGGTGTLGKAVSEYTAGIGRGAGRLASAFGNTLEGAAAGVADSSKSLWDLGKAQMKSTVNTGLDAIAGEGGLVKRFISAIESVFKSAKTALTKILPKVPSGPFVDKVKKTIIEKLTSSSIVGKLARRLASAAALDATGLIIFADVASCLYGGWKGYNATEEYFEVPEGTATIPMQVLATLAGAVAGEMHVGIALDVLGMTQGMDGAKWMVKYLLLPIATGMRIIDENDILKLQAQAKGQNPDDVSAIYKSTQQIAKEATSEGARILRDKNLTGAERDEAAEEATQRAREEAMRSAWHSLTNLLPWAKKDEPKPGTTPKPNQNTPKPNAASMPDGKYGRGAMYESQLDPENAMRMQVPGDTEYMDMANRGCGEIATVNALHAQGNMYVTGRDAGMFALKGGRGKFGRYKRLYGRNRYLAPDDGTSPNFIHDYARANGMNTTDIGNRKDFDDYLNSGGSVVVSGIDPSNSTRPLGGGESLFTNNHHYVTVVGRGIDRYGRATINAVDSEQSGTLNPKPKQYLEDGFYNKLKYMVGVKGRGRGKYGRERSTVDDAPAIWKYLTQDKKLSNVVAAGMMGNWLAESSMYSDRLEGEDPDSGSNKAPIDGQTGYGLAQWTYQSRQQALHDFASERNQQDSDWKTQIDFSLSGKDGDVSDMINNMHATNDPYEAAMMYHDQYERSADTPEKKQRRGEFAKKYFEIQGKGVVNDNGFVTNGSGTQTSSSSGGNQKSSLTGFDMIDNAIKGLKDTELGKTLAKFSPFFNNFFNGGGGTSGGAGASGNWASSSTEAGIKQASAWAQYMVGKEGYGNNGCTAFVKNYLLQADNIIGKYMEDGTPITKELEDAAQRAQTELGESPNATLMWVPTLECWAKNKGYWKNTKEGAEGDICVCNNHGHVIIADGKGGAWGNSSSENKILHYDSIVDYYGEPDGYIATGAGKGTVSTGELKRTQAEINAEAGSSNAGTNMPDGKYGRAKNNSRKKGAKDNSKGNPKQGVSKVSSFKSFTTKRYGRSNNSNLPIWKQDLMETRYMDKPILNKNGFGRAKKPDISVEESINKITNKKDLMKFFDKYDLRSISNENHPNDNDDLLTLKQKAINVAKTGKKKHRNIFTSFWGALTGGIGSFGSLFTQLFSNTKKVKEQAQKNNEVIQNNNNTVAAVVDNTSSYDDYENDYDENDYDEEEEETPEISNDMLDAGARTAALRRVSSTTDEYHGGGGGSFATTAAEERAKAQVASRYGAYGKGKHALGKYGRGYQTQGHQSVSNTGVISNEKLDRLIEAQTETNQLLSSILQAIVNNGKIFADSANYSTEDNEFTTARDLQSVLSGSGSKYGRGSNYMVNVQNRGKEYIPLAYRMHGVASM